MVISFHHRVDDIIGMLMALGGEVEVDHGRVQTAVAQILLDATDVDAGFQQMRGIAVPEGMNGDAFGDSELFEHASQCPLHRCFRHGSRCLWTFVAAASESGEYPEGISMPLPVVSQEIKRRFRQGHIPVLGALSPMDMDAHPLSVDIDYLKKQGLMQPESTGIHGSQIRFILNGSNCIDNGPDFFQAEYGGQSLFSFGMDELQGVPVTFEHVDKKELDAAVADAHRSGCPCIDVSTVQEVVLQFLFADQIRCFAVKVDQHPYRAGVAFLGGLAHTGQLQGSHGLLVIIFHHTSPFLCYRLIKWL